MMGGGILGLGFIGMLLTLGLPLVLIVGVAVWLVRQFGTGRQDTWFAQSPGTGQKSSLEILEERYARGELTREQYQLIKNDLN